MSWPPTHKDLFRFGLPAAACVPDVRALDSITVAGGIFECRGHGFTGGENVRFAPGVGGTLPTGITSSLTWYPVSPPSDNDFFTITGLSLSDAGTLPVSVIEDITPKLDDMMERRASWLVAWWKAINGPLAVPPDWAPMIVAQLCAFDVARQLRTASARFNLDDVRKVYEEAKAFLDRLDKGSLFNDGVGPIDGNPTVADMGAHAVKLKSRHFLEHDEDRA